MRRRPARTDADLVTADRTSISPDGTFADVFRDHYSQVMRLAYLYCGDRHAAEDAVADAMANVFVRWQDGKVHDVGPYLRRAVVNEVRRRARRAGVALRYLGRREGDLRGDHVATEQVEDRDEILGALQRLPERQRLAIVLRYYEHLSEAETAEMMGISVGGVKSQTSRALDQLRALLRVEEAGS